MSSDYGEQAATGDGGMLADCAETEVVLRELRSIEAVIPHLVPSSSAQLWPGSRARRILATGQTILDRQDTFRQINLTDPPGIARQVSKLLFAETVYERSFQDDPRRIRHGGFRRAMETRRRRGRS